MKYIEWDRLLQAGAVEQDAPIQVKGILLVAENPCFSWEDNFSQYGNDNCLLYPAVYNGGRVFVVEENWQSGNGYSATGTNQKIIGLKAGVRLLIDKGAVDLLYQD